MSKVSQILSDQENFYNEDFNMQTPPDFYAEDERERINELLELEDQLTQKSLQVAATILQLSFTQP